MEEDVQELYEKGGVEANITGESSNKTDAFLRDETNQTPKNGKGKDHKESSSEPENSGEDDSHVPKKRRLIWTTEMHQKFLDAIEQIGHDRAFPKKIVEVMNVPGLTRENVASHLQKYRICLKKVQEGMDKYYWGSNTEANCTRVPYTYESLLGTSRLPFSGSSQLASRNFYSMSSSSHSSLYGQGSAIGTSRVRLAPPSYSSFDVSSLSINTGNVPNQYNQMTEVNTNVRGYCDDKRNKLLSILNRRPPSNTPDDHATASSSTSNSAFIGLRIASDGKSLFLGGSDRSEIVSAENYSAKRSEFNLQESALPLLPCSNIENYLQDSSLPPLPGSTVEDHFGESSFPSFPEFQVENSWQQLKSSENEQISWQQLAKDIEDDLITFNPQQETYGTNETENGHTGTYLEQQNCLQSLPWEILENADLEMIKKILPNNHTVNPLPSLSAQSNPNPNMTSYLLNNNLSNQEDSLPPLPSDIPWSLYPDSNSSNHSTHVLNQQSQLPPIISETGWNETSDVSMPLNNISDHQNLLPSFPSDYFWNLDSDPVHPIIVPPSLPEAYEGAVQQLPSLPDNTVNQVIPQPINTYFSETNLEEGIGDIRNLEEGIGDIRNLEEGIGDIRNLEEGIGDSSPGLLDFIGFHDTLSNE